MTSQPTKHRSNDHGGEQAETLAALKSKRGGVAIRRLANVGLTFCWTLNVMLLVAAFVWVYRDGRSRSMIEQAKSLLTFDDASSLRQVFETYGVAPPVWIVFVAALIASVTLAGMFCGLFLGAGPFRSVRMWLVFTAMAAGWLGFVVSWPEVYWHGQRQRMSTLLTPVEALAVKLNTNWPIEDGYMEEVGPFLAYPKGNPTTVLPLQTITFPNTKLQFSAIERTKDGTIRFELSGKERGAWLEWRADDNAPAAFVGGLETSYNVTRQQRLAPRWFLVRYRASAGGVVPR